MRTTGMVLQDAPTVAFESTTGQLRRAESELTVYKSYDQTNISEIRSIGIIASGIIAIGTSCAGREGID